MQIVSGGPPVRDDRLIELDAMRGLAALAVVLYHFTWRYSEMFPDAQSVGWGLPWGRFGVEIFFGISGFVIIMTLKRTRVAADFVVSRFTRLFPAYWAAVLLTTAIVMLSGVSALAVPGWAVFANMTMLEWHLSLPMVDGAYWSLGVELSFYVVMLAVWRLRLLDKVELVLLGWIGLKFLWWLVPVLPWRLGQALIVEYIPFFAIGVVAFRVWCGERRWVQQIPLLLCGMGAVMLIDPRPLIFVYLASITFFVLLSQGRLALLRQGWLLQLGAISYTLYLVHQNIGYVVMHALESAGVTGWVAVLGALVTAIGLAYAITHWVERPAQSHIRSAWRNKIPRVQPV